MRGSSGTRPAAHQDRIRAASWRQPRSKRGSRMETKSSMAAVRIAAVQSVQVGAKSSTWSRRVRRPHLVLTRVWSGRRSRWIGLLRSQEMWVAGTADRPGDVAAFVMSAAATGSGCRLPSVVLPGVRTAVAPLARLAYFGMVIPRREQHLKVRLPRSEWVRLLPVPGAAGAVAPDHAGEVVHAVLLGDRVVEEGLDLAAGVQHRLLGAAGALLCPRGLPEPLDEQCRVVVLLAH